MKRKLLSLAALLTFGAAAHAQVSGITIKPTGVANEYKFTIENPDAVCTPNGKTSVAGGTVIRIHGGVIIGGQEWQAVKAAGTTDATAPETVFTLSATTQKWEKIINIETYYDGMSTLTPDVTAAAVEGFCFVLNAGDAADHWASEGKNTENNCDNFIIPLPLTGAILGTTSVKAGLTKANLLTRVTNPVQKGAATQISYNLPKASDVTVSVTNMLGQTVATLANGFQSAGEQTVSFDAAKLTAGMYFYTVKAGNLTDTKKVVVVE
jgi:hypothetical protein